MDGDGSWLLIAIIIMFLFFSAYFAGCESAFSSMNKIRMKRRADDGDRRAKKANYIVNNFEKAITTLLIGNNIVNTAASSVATIWALRAFRAGMFGSATEKTVTVISTIAITAIVFLFGEIIPKSFANDRSNFVAIGAAGSLHVLMKIMTPISAFFTLISVSVSKLFAVEKTPSITEDELYDIIETIEDEGVFDEEQSDLFKSALGFSKTTAADIMTMRGDIRALNIGMTNIEILKEVLASKHSRLPVYSGTLDNVLGTLQIRTFLKEYSKNPKVDARKLLTPPFRVGADAKIDYLLSVMKQKKTHLALVTDESGSILGLVTIEDFLEELVGEIWDEDDVVDPDFVKLGGNRFLVNTKLHVGDVFGRMGVVSSNSLISSRSIASWVSESLAKTPEEEDIFMYDNIEVTIEKIEDGKIEQVIFKVCPAAPASDIDTANIDLQVAHAISQRGEGV